MKESKLIFLPPEHKERFGDFTSDDREEYKKEINIESHSEATQASVERAFDNMKEEELKYQAQGFSDAGLINVLHNRNDKPDKAIYSDGMLYAFVWTNPSNEEDLDKTDDSWKYYALWCAPVGEIHLDDWTEVSDLTGVAVFTYQRLRDTAIAIGWIRDDNRTWLI